MANGVHLSKFPITEFFSNSIVVGIPRQNTFFHDSQQWFGHANAIEGEKQ